MVEPVAGGTEAVAPLRPPTGEETLARAASGAREAEKADRAETLERPPEPAVPMPRSWSQPVPAADLGTNIDLLI